MKFRKVVVLWAAALVVMLCAAANAVEVVPYKKIPEEAIVNTAKATKTWRGREVRINGVVIKVDINYAGNAEVMFEEKYGYNTYQYVFKFDGVPDDVTELEKGQRAAIIGRVSKINSFGPMVDGEVYVITVSIERARLN